MNQKDQQVTLKYFLNSKMLKRGNSKMVQEMTKVSFPANKKSD